MKRGRSTLTRLLRHRSDRAVFAGALLLIALLTPWSVPIRPLHWTDVFGWQSPVSVVAIAAMAAIYLRRARPFTVPLAILSGIALLGWLGWVIGNLLTGPFAHSAFPFLPIDLLGEGWYIAALAFVITVDGLAQSASRSERRATGFEVWPFALVPGMGLVRLHYPMRGRLWFVGFAISIFLLQTNAVGVEEFQYYASLGGLPPGRARIGALIPAVLALILWLLSLWDTRARLRLEKTADDSAVMRRESRDSRVV